MASSANPTEDRIVGQIARQTEDPELAVEAPAKREPVYKMIGDTKIPTSKKHGRLWESRLKAGRAKMEARGLTASWDEALRYYHNDQRTGIDAKSRPNTSRSIHVGDDNWVETENIVFANTSALVPAIYAKNPTAEVTSLVPNDEEYEKRATQLERLLNVLGGKKAAPGFNMKPKARKSVIMAALTNIAYIEIGYTMKEESSEDALADLTDAATRLAEAKEIKDIEEIEGELEALEQKIDFLRPSGPYVKFRHPKDVIRDPDSTEADLSDCKWIIVGDYISTSYINAVFRQKNEDGELASAYEPTHIISVNSGSSIDDEINSFSLFNHDQASYRSYGYEDEDSFRKAQRTKVWYVWDKITRRVYMYSDKDWKWPVWVWDDPYNIDQFFPVYALEFYTDPEEDIAKSEVMYYLDHQDAINEINAEKRKMRSFAANNIFYNLNLIKDVSHLEAFMKGGKTDRKPVGVDLPPDVDIRKAIFSLLPPSGDYIQLFDTAYSKAAATAISSVQPVMQGEQFKTNTTNDAIETYNSAQQTRLDEKIDAIEDFIGNIYWGIAQMLLQFMPPEEVAIQIGAENAAGWSNQDALTIRSSYSCQIVGGSSQKPTSKTKQDTAIKVGQILGQFASATPAAVIIALKVMQRAFDEVVITEEEWAMISQSLGDQQQAQQILEMIKIYNGLPPEAKQALADATSQGVPIEQALPQLIQELQAAQGQQPQQPASGAV